MAVRVFDVVPERSDASVVELPTSRQSLRRSRQRAAVLAVSVLSAPFAVALIVLGVIR